MDSPAPDERSVALAGRAADQRYCHACGVAMHSTAVFCPQCGATQAGGALALPSHFPPAVVTPLQYGQVYCRGCGAAIHQSANACPQCGASHNGSVVHYATPAPPTPWLAIVSLTLGIVCMMSFMDDGDWTSSSILGLFMFAAAGLGTGTAAAASSESSGRGIAVVGIVLSSLALLAAVGLAIS